MFGHRDEEMGKPTMQKASLFQGTGVLVEGLPCGRKPRYVMGWGRGRAAVGGVTRVSLGIEH